MSVSFGAKVVVSGFSLSVTSNSITLLVGGNGTGKSTVLRAVAGIIPSRGRIFFDGVDITQCSTKERHKIGISYLVQQRGVFYRMTVRENIAFATRGVARYADDMLELPCPGSTWAKLWRKPASDLSIGQQRALAIAMALNRRPALALLDEPFAGLSPPVAEELAAYFSHLVSSEGFTVMLVDHNLQLCSTISDRVYAMQLGAARLLPAGVSAEDIASLLLNSDSKNQPTSATEGGL
jgi:branched-chain amino acid transport system ATP-binding protein